MDQCHHKSNWQMVEISQAFSCMALIEYRPNGESSGTS